MANKERTLIPGKTDRTLPRALGGDAPEWLDRVRRRLNLVPTDAAKNIYLERAFAAVIELTQALPSRTLEQSAAAGSNLRVLFRSLQNPEVPLEWERFEPLAGPYLRGIEE